MRIIHNIILFVAGLLLLGCGQTFTPQEYKTADAVYLNLQHEYQLNVDGSQVYKHSHQLRLQTHAAFNSMYGESFILFNPEYQQLEILRAETEKTDGKMIASGDNAFNLILPRFAQKSKAYNQLREMVVTHLGTEVGAVLNLDYELKSNKDFAPALMKRIDLTQHSPIRNLKVVVKVPKGVELKYKLMNIEGKQKKIEKDGYLEYVWEFTNVPAIENEALSLKNGANRAQLLVSTAQQENLKAFLKGQSAFGQEVSQVVKNEVSAIVQGKETDLDKVLALQQYVISRVALVDVPWGMDAFLCRTPMDCWNSNSGTELEKSLLLAGLISTQGVPARVVGVVLESNSGNVLDNIQIIDRFLVLVELPEQSYNISAIKSNSYDLKADLAGCRMVYLPDLKWRDFDLTRQNKVKLSGTFQIDESQNMKGKAQLEMQGENVPYLSLKRNVEDTKNLMLCEGEKKGVIQRMDSHSTRIEFSFDEMSLLVYGDYRELKLPICKQGIASFHLPTLLQNRRTALELPRTLEEEYRYTIELPEGLKLLNPEYLVRDTSSVVDLTMQLQANEGRVFLSRKLLLKKRIVSPEEYAGFKRIVNLWNHPRYQSLMLK